MNGVQQWTWNEILWNTGIKSSLITTLTNFSLSTNNALCLMFDLILWLKLKYFWNKMASLAKANFIARVPCPIHMLFSYFLYYLTKILLDLKWCTIKYPAGNQYLPGFVCFIHTSCITDSLVNNYTHFTLIISFLP